jgi:hypothetical protein
MKVYNLCCDQNHDFEGWFSSEQDFLLQSDRHQIACPICDSANIRRLPSAPHLNLSQTAAGSTPVVDVRNDLAPERQSAYLEMARYVLQNTEDVGERFTEEARRIHYNEVPSHGIRGIATPSQRDALEEEGIDVVELALPVLLKQSLQ